MTLLERHKITKEETAITIAAAMFFVGADDDMQIDEITSLAGLLEVPTYYSDQEWDRLVMLIVQMEADCKAESAANSNPPSKTPLASSAR